MTNEPPVSAVLLPCPFCGKRPLIVCPDNSYGSAMVTCGDDNECPVDLTAWADLKSGETLSDAIAAWNRRPTVTPDAEMVEAQQATIERLSAALEKAELAMTCGPEDAACYCPNCDNSLYGPRDEIRTALSSSRDGRG